MIGLQVVCVMVYFGFDCWLLLVGCLFGALISFDSFTWVFWVWSLCFGLGACVCADCLVVSIGCCFLVGVGGSTYG